MENPVSVSNAPIMSGVKGRCPRCADGAMFEGFLNLSKECENCGLNYDFADSADGPAVFVILLAGFLIVGLALMVEIFYQPPYWLHAALWLPTAIIIPLLMLRPLKGALIGLQYRNSAKEARFDENGIEID